MYLEVEDVVVFKKIIEAVANMIDEGTFEASPEGLKLRSMDSSQISMVDLFIPKEAFSKFEVPNARRFSINLQDLLKIIGRAKGMIAVDLADDSSKISIELKSDSKKQFKLPLLDLQQAAIPKEPAIPFEANIKIKSDSLKELIKDAGLLAAYIILDAHDDIFSIEAQGDSGELKTETKKGSPAISEFELKAQKARAMFPSEYLDKITKAATGEEAIMVSLKNDAPVKIEYSIQKAKLKYFLAPRIEN
jgi:proliferating cell nuclear antigen